MGTKDPRVDAYIDDAADFAKPILRELRKRMHAAIPGLVETMKWKAPHFEYNDHVFAGMSAFKQHCAFGFWHPLMRNGDTSLEGMGGFGKIGSVADLPRASEFTKLAKQAKKLEDEGVKGPPRPKPAPNRRIETPADLAAALKKNAKARATYEAFPYSSRKDYVEWITGAKREETRRQRVATAVQWLAEGKRRHWKYEK
jgi:uncharacterized protein YdeI (YjbR/CyaY-like superfamily)